MSRQLFEELCKIQCISGDFYVTYYALTYFLLTQRHSWQNMRNRIDQEAPIPLDRIPRFRPPCFLASSSATAAISLAIREDSASFLRPISGRCPAGPHPHPDLSPSPPPDGAIDGTGNGTPARNRYHYKILALAPEIASIERARGRSEVRRR